jgi:amino acid efflux transporter
MTQGMNPGLLESRRETGKDAGGDGGLGRRRAIPLAIGSVAGSGILFLPSAVYVEAGRNSLLVWVLSTLVCLPMLLMFEDMVRANPAGNGIQACIRAGLGDVLGRCVPLLFLSLVMVGLPAGALVAGRYVASTLGAGELVTVLTAALVLLAALLANLAGVRTNARVQNAGAWTLLAMAAVLLGAAMLGGRLGSGMAAVAPDGGSLGVLLPGVVLAMWAFAGFENLTFLGREFRRPERDFLPVAAAALGVYGLLTILLTIAIAMRVPRGGVDQVVGLLQLADTMRPRRVVVAAVTVIAFGAMVLNSVAWVWGVSRLVAGAADAAILPRALARTGPRGVPRRVVLLFGCLFAVTLAVLAVVPGFLVDTVATASAIFILLYLLCIVAYVRVRGLSPRSVANLPLLLLLAASLARSGWRSVYGPVVLVLALTTLLVQRRRARRGSAASQE